MEFKKQVNDTNYTVNETHGNQQLINVVDHRHQAVGDMARALSLEQWEWYKHGEQ